MASPSPTPTLLSDIGNVLVRFDFRIAARRVAEQCPFPEESLFQRLETIKGPYEDGAMDDTTFVREAIAALEFRGSEAKFAQIWCEIFTENTAMARSLAPLAGRVPLNLLSNTSGLHKDYLLRTYDVFRLFEGGIYSYSARCSKPGEAIFRHTIQELGLDPSLTLFVDDLPANIATARELGFQTHLYDLQDHAAFEKVLADWCLKHHV